MVLRKAGGVLVFLGVVLLLFTAYQLWGTGFLEARSQQHLRAELRRILPPPLLDQPAPSPPAAGTLPALAPAAPPPATGAPIGVLRIPSIGLDQVVVQGIGTAQLRAGPGHYPDTPLPGEAGNVAIAGHRTTYAHPFYDLADVHPGAVIDISTAQGQFVYRATTTTVVPPSDVAVLQPAGRAVLTLTTCNPLYSATSRLVLRATLTASVLSPTTHNPNSGPALGTSASRPRGRGRPGGEAAAPAGIDRSRRGAGDDNLDWIPAAGWGALVVALALTVPRLAGRLNRRWPVYLVGGLTLFAALLFLFSAAGALLPPTL